MAKYQIIFAKRVEGMVLRHTEFLARVSVPAARTFYREFEDTLRRVGENPYQFPVEEDRNLPQGQYRGALFAKRYKALFTVAEKTVYLDAVVDCRMDNKVTLE
jgi:plasmid stabilization system protein ParE